jgi:hypothetical protein
MAEEKPNGGAKFDGSKIRELLQSLPINERAETIVEIFRIISTEFAAMVLEHVEPPPDKPH